MFERLTKIFRRTGKGQGKQLDYPDPLMHPALMAMSERELADLPMSAGYGRRSSDGNDRAA